MGDETEYDDMPPLVDVRQGHRSASTVDVVVSHDLGDRTLVVVILLAIVIGACGLVMGLNLAKQDQLGMYARDIAAKQQIQINHTKDLEAQVKVATELNNERR